MTDTKDMRVVIVDNSHPNYQAVGRLTGKTVKTILCIEMLEMELEDGGDCLVTEGHIRRVENAD